MKKSTVWDRIRSIVKGTKDESKVEEVIKDAEKEEEQSKDNHIHIHGGGERTLTDEDINERFSTLETALTEGLQGVADSISELKKEKDSKAKDAEEEESRKKEADAAREKEEKETEDAISEEANEGTKDKAPKAKDSAYMTDSYQETASLAEILCPGIHIPSFDHAAPPKKTVDAICALRRSSLELAYHRPETRPLIDQVHGFKPLDLSKMSCRDTRTLFRSVAALAKTTNGKSVTVNDRPMTSGGGIGAVGKVKSQAELNAALRKHYGQE